VNTTKLNYTPVGALYWIKKFQSERLSLRKFTAKYPEGPSAPTLCRMLKRYKEGAGEADKKPSLLNDSQKAILIFLAPLEGLPRKKGGLTTAEIACLALFGSDDDIRFAGDNKLLRSTLGRGKPGQPVRLKRNEYNQCKAYLKRLKTGYVWVSNGVKTALQNCYLVSGCGSRNHGHVCSIDEYVIPNVLLDWGDGRPPSRGSRVIVITQEGPISQIRAVLLIRGEPCEADYATAVWIATYNTQSLTTLPPSRIFVLISDNTGAASDNFNDFCKSMGVVHRWARARLPHAKRAVEAANYILQRRGIPSLRSFDFVSYSPQRGIISVCSAKSYFDSVLLAAYEFNRECPKNSGYNRAELAQMQLQFFRFPLDADGLGIPKPLLRQVVLVSENEILTTDCARFRVQGSESLPNGRYLAMRSIAPECEQLNLITDDGIYTAIKIQKGTIFP
jgi:hypothetical protein